MALTRDAVVDAAVDLLGEVGLEGLSLRRLARELGVSAPTLYWHVADKRALLDHVAERLLADQWRAPGPAEGQPWWEWLHERALAQYRALVTHRDAALVVAGNRPTEDALPVVEATVATLVAAGLSPREAFWTIMAIGHFVIGSAVEYHAEQDRARTATPPPHCDHERGHERGHERSHERGHDPGAHPHLAALAADLGAATGERHEEVVSHGLDLMIGGLRARWG
ncbi:TetR/AcrR family transcriptional regulator C-terminal domain-containing protein [Actinomycetospora cinnamomea]|uniref:TetR family transcriptional regulator n=1 Tax=Actinomycetospora cinnamomea TaxID=663609 RepID=A0A2U1FQJ8_9PSEU|nr:TetR/AcrR family transcriptional regulator C-terminal domain-containing protein [Actinomycetospora cinnamomea]PVZ14458.1 TetR family transcriptional regulator [Actinomycetospora cinnamomea]